MNIELSALEERAEAKGHIGEALRILNAAIRRTHRAGLSVKVDVLTMY
jgi:RNA binding exosome subunit